MIKNIVIAGGAVKTLALLGAISYLEDKKILKLKDTHTFIGSSAGSIISLLLSLGYDSKETFTILNNLMMKYESQETSADCIFKIFESYGMDEGSLILQWCVDIIYEKYKIKDPTFLEFTKKSGKNLCICATNITSMKFEVFSVNNSPMIKVSEAVRASISIPFIFTPFVINENYYVDAGILNNFPIDHIQFTNLTEFDTIGLCIKVSEKKNNITNLLSYLQQICLTITNNNSIYNPCIMCKKMQIIQVSFEDDSFIDFDLETFKLKVTHKVLETYYKKGYDYMTTDYRVHTTKESSQALN
jgi:NTE family protein